MVARWVGMVLVAGLLAACAGSDPPMPAAPPPEAPPPAALAEPDPSPLAEPDPSPLAGLVAACLDGDLAGCDELYEQSAAGSAEELVGDTCGGRQLAGTAVWCVDAAEPEDDRPTPGSDGPFRPVVVLTAVCLHGDLEACDELYRGSEAGTAARVIGDTCGGRQLAGTGAWCAGEPALADVGSAPGSVEPDGERARELEACLDGDMPACDRLYSAADLGTTARVIGDTCGGRELVGWGRWCGTPGHVRSGKEYHPQEFEADGD